MIRSQDINSGFETQIFDFVNDSNENYSNLEYKSKLLDFNPPGFDPACSGQQKFQ